MNGEKVKDGEWGAVIGTPESGKRHRDSLKVREPIGQVSDLFKQEASLFSSL